MRPHPVWSESKIVRAFRKLSCLLYWSWRLSRWSDPWYAARTFLHVHLHARRTAVQLDECMRALGQMRHLPENGKMEMSVEARSKLIRDGYGALPSGWKWRD